MAATPMAADFSMSRLLMLLMLIFYTIFSEVMDYQCVAVLKMA
jgi:hypothetical protein